MKNINKEQLKVISMKFRTITNRLITCSHQTRMALLKEFMTYTDENEIVSEYIKQYTNPDDFEPVERETCFSSMDDTKQGEISYTCQYLKYTVENYHSSYHDIASRYTREVNDTIKEFCNRVILPFVNYVEGYLTEIGIQMGYDEDKKFMINVDDDVTQVNTANDNTTVHGTQSNGIDVPQLENTIFDVMKRIPTDITQEEQGQVSDSIEVVWAEMQSTSPRKGFIKAALKGLQAISGTTQFGSAIATLVQFLETVL